MTLKNTTAELKKIDSSGSKFDPDENGRIKIIRGKDSRIRVVRDGREIPVNIFCCFPWSAPGDYISLRDDNEEEVAFVSHLADIEKQSRKVLESALEKSGFVMEITSIKNIDEDFEIRNWHVVTRQGVRKFQTKLDEWPYEAPGGGLLIKDLAGDLYFIADSIEMDKNSKKQLWTVSD